MIVQLIDKLRSAPTELQFLVVADCLQELGFAEHAWAMRLGFHPDVCAAWYGGYAGGYGNFSGYGSGDGFDGSGDGGSGSGFDGSGDGGTSFGSGYSVGDSLQVIS